jgi:hypothetical protein
MKRHLGLIAALAFGVASVALGQGTATLPTYLPCTVETGARPSAIATANFDQNGLPDIALLDESGNQVVVLLTDPDLFAVGACREGIQRRNVAVGAEPQGIAVGDFDRNGKPDIVVVESRGARVLAGDGTGGFTSQAPIPAGSQPQSVAVGDFDGDGVQDIAVGTGSDQTVEILYGIAAGGFLEPPMSISIGQTVTSMLAADLNVDGRLDLALLSYEGGTVTVLLRDANEPRRFERLDPFEVGELPTSLATGDFDRDGNPDLAVTVRGTGLVGELEVFFGTVTNETVDFTARQSFAASTGPNPSAMVSGFLNTDGWLDAVVANEGNHTIGFYVGGEEPILALADACDDSCSNTCCIAQGPRVVTAVRLDADALPDVVVGSEQNGTITFFLSSNPPSTPTRTPTLTPTMTWTPSLTPTITETRTPTLTPSLTPPATATPSRTPTLTRTPTITNTETPGPFSLQGSSCAIDGGRGDGNGLAPILLGVGLLVLSSLHRAGRQRRGVFPRR